jgi:glycosyltransferase involved in cell wall biosynthesis
VTEEVDGRVERRRDLPRASVIIRTKNEQAALGTTIEAVLAQQVPPHELLVIDSGSTDRTLEIAARYPVRILAIAPADWGYARALNRAASEATGDVLVCLSAHCVPIDRAWLGALLAPFADARVAGVWGPQLRPGRPAPAAGSPLCQEPGSYSYANRTWGLSNANAAVRRDMWAAFPFDETMPAAEDKAWGRDAMNRGYCIVHEPAAAVWHAKHAPADAYHRQRAVMEGFARMFPEMERGVRAQGPTAMRAAWRLVRYHLSARDPRALWADVRRLPSTAAAIIGGMRARGPRT